MKSKFFEEAKKESHLSDYDGAHLGAVAVYKNKFILAKAHNTHKTNPTQFYYNRYRIKNKVDILSKPARAHAEIQLYRKIRFLNVPFKDVTVYIYRELKDGSLAIAKPCSGCEKALLSLGIRVVCWTESNGYVEKKYN